MDETTRAARPMVYWHRDLPPVSGEIIADHVVEAQSGRVPGTLAHRDELWDRCYDQLMAAAQARIEPTEAWLHGRFSYVLYRDPSRPAPPTS